MGAVHGVSWCLVVGLSWLPGGAWQRDVFSESKDA
jgi:hypothetical protein